MSYRRRSWASRRDPNTRDATDYEGEDYYAWLDQAINNSVQRPNWIRELSMVIDRAIKRSAQFRMMENTRASGQRFVSVLVGKTCAWCIMQATRGPVFRRNDLFWHDECDCELVPEKVLRQIPGWLNTIENIDSKIKSSNYRGSYVEKIRREFPNLVTDGVFEVPRNLAKPRFVAGVKFEPVTRKRWHHIMSRHAPGGTTSDIFSAMSSNEIGMILERGITDPLAISPAPKVPRGLNFHQRLPDGREFIVSTLPGRNGGDLEIITAFAPSDPDYLRLR